MRRCERPTFDPTRPVLRVTFRFEGGPAAVTGSADVELRWFDRYELEHVSARAGFAAIEVLGGFDRRPWGAGSETVVVAR